MIDWNRSSTEEVLAINRIAKMAKTLDGSLDLLRVQMDLEACHTHGCPLDLERMANGQKGDLMHDVSGIAAHLDRETGELLDCFVPRFAR